MKLTGGIIDKSLIKGGFDMDDYNYWGIIKLIHKIIKIYLISIIMMELISDQDCRNQ